MIYLDYSATTKTDKKVLNRFIKVNQSFINPNSNYKQAVEVSNLIDKDIENIKQLLNTNDFDLIFTSGASEANNMAIKGLTDRYQNKHIITTKLEHSSVVGPIGYLQNKGFKIDFVNLDKNGQVDLNHLKELINEDTLLVSICAVDSETGTRQPIEKIGLMLKNYDQLYFHTDITQCLGKVAIDLTNVDLASASGHKIYGFKGIGFLLKKQDIKIVPLIHGGKSTTIYRGGTPCPELIDSLNTCLGLLMPKIEENYRKVRNLNDYLKEGLKKHPQIILNSTSKAIPHILNFSIIDKDPFDVQKYLAEHDILISTQTACSLNTDLSLAVLAVTGSELQAKTSLRISLSYKTTKKEIDIFLKLLGILLGGKNESN
jgi:cysteine desulfurase